MSPLLGSGLCFRYIKLNPVINHSDCDILVLDLQISLNEYTML